MSKFKVVVQWSDLLIRLPQALGLPDSEKRLLGEAALEDRIDLVIAHEPDKLEREIVDADFMITENRIITAALLSRAKRLRLIQNGRVRHDRIDIVAARRAGIDVSAVALPCEIDVVEHAFLLMMALGKKLIQADAAARRSEHRSQSLTPHVTSRALSSLYGRTLGIVGLGEIGEHVAHRARAFGMRVLYTSKTRRPADDERRLCVQYRSLQALMAESDIVDLHVEEIPETRHLIGREQLTAMKPHAFLINTSRGSIVDEDALVDALRARRIGGAGLDVFAQEPLPHEHPLKQLDNVVLTPHIAGMGSVVASVEVLFGDIGRVIRGETPLHVVN